MKLCKLLVVLSLFLSGIVDGFSHYAHAQAGTEEVVWFIHGSGDSVEQIPVMGDGAFVARIHGNLLGKYFSVTTYDSLGDYVELLVNTGDSYFGIVPFNFNAYDIQDISGGLVEVKAVGEWSIEVMALTSLAFAYNNQSIVGYGDVVAYVKGRALTAIVVGNEKSKYFSVSAVGIDGESVDSDLLVNTSDPYQGNVRLPRNSDGFILIIRSSDTWGIMFNSSEKDKIFDTSIAVLRPNPYSPFRDIFTSSTVTPQSTVQPTGTPSKTVSPTVTPQKTASATATPTSTETVSNTVTAGIVNRDANLRSGPGTNQKIVGGVKAGNKVVIVGGSPDGSWLQLDNGAWIAAFLVHLD